LRVVPERRDKRHKPARQIRLPPRIHGRPLEKPTTYESPQTHLGNSPNAPTTKDLPKSALGHEYRERKSPCVRG
jgi:hypothetical protein